MPKATHRKTVDAQAVKKRFLKMARVIGKRKRITPGQLFDIMFIGKNA